MAEQEAQQPHRPRKVLETDQIIVYDDFLPIPDLQQLYVDFLRSNYRYINTTGNVSRAWRIRDGFPLRGNDIFYFAEGEIRPEEKWAYPAGHGLDIFVRNMKGLLPEVEHVVGKESRDWKNFSATQWIYPAGTGLSLHDDGSNTYSGAFTYFLSKEWNLHWGGLLLVLDRRTDMIVKDFKQRYGEFNFWAEKWTSDEIEAKLVQEPGFGQFIYPKFNRIVFIKNDALHAVTNVTEAAGDRNRQSIAGFFHIRPQGAGKNGY